MNAPLDPYRVLQILPDADQEEIKVAFRRLARRYHPDRAPDAASMARMIEVNRAWELIGDPVRRAAYDRANGIVRGPRPVERVRRDPAPGSPSPESADTREPGEPSDTTPGHTSGRTPHPAGSPGVGSEAVSGAAGPPGQGPGHRPSPASDPVRRDDPTDGRAPVRPGRPSGTVLTFGRYEGWSLGEIARVDREYLEWLVRMPIGWQYGDEIRALLAGPRPEPPVRPARNEPRRRFPFGR